MKRIFFNIFSFLILSSLMISCDDELEISPEDSLTADGVFSSEFAVKGAVTGLYSQALNINALNGNRYAYTGIQADELTFVGSFTTLVDVFTYSTQATNGSTQEFWDEGYEIINNANFIIKTVPDLEILNFTDEEKALAIAQAKFMRAVMYFEMLRVYAQPFQFDGGNSLGLPISTEPFTDSTSPDEFNIPRSSVNEVQQFIISDLEDAIDILPVSADNTKASKGSAMALLARLKLYREEWNDAANLANEVIQSGSYSFASDYGFFGTLSNENVFVLANNATDGAVGVGLHALATPRPSGRGDMFYSDYILEAFNSGIVSPSNTEGSDLRLVQTTIEGSDTNGDARIFLNKINSSGNIPLPVIRITEMYFIRAEANLRGGLNIGDTPLNDINRIRRRAGLVDLTVLSLDDILLERYKEFAVEGHRRMDLLRNRRSLRPSGNSQFSDSQFGENKTIFPIPAREINVNPALREQQNPGY